MTLGEWRERFVRQYRQYINELTQRGVDTAQSIFDSADPDYSDSGYVSVTREEIDAATRIIIRASGEAAPFIEFGAGVLTDVMRPTVRASYDIAPGSWSEQGTGEFKKYGSWHHAGQKYFGLPPLAPMQEACNTMEQESSSIARSVFG